MTARPFHRTTFRAFVLGTRQDYLVDFEAPPATLADAVAAAQSKCAHKGKLAIRETDQLTGATKLHVYTIRQQARANYVWRDHQQVRVQPLYAELLVTLHGPVLTGEDPDAWLKVGRGIAPALADEAAE